MNETHIEGQQTTNSMIAYDNNDAGHMAYIEDVKDSE